MFWECSFLPLVHIRESPEFSSIVNIDKTGWHRCLLWHGWLPALSGTGRGTPWAIVAVDIAEHQLEAALGSYVDAHSVPFEGFQLDESDQDIAAGPFVWTDGSLVLRSLRLVLPGQLIMPVLLVNPGSTGGAVILICYLPCLMEGVRHVDYSVLSRAPCSRFSVLRSGEFWLHFKVALPCILGLTT